MFVAAVAPKVAVVSVGEYNRFGDPVHGVIERYESAGVPFPRTNRDGAVTASANGETLTVRAYLERHAAPRQRKF